MLEKDIEHYTQILIFYVLPSEKTLTLVTFNVLTYMNRCWIHENTISYREPIQKGKYLK